MHDSFKNWASYYGKLYTNTCGIEAINQRPSLLVDPLLTGTQRKQLNADITISEIIHAINSLKDNTTPGKDLLLSRDLTILLHVEDGKKSADYPESWIILNFLKELLAGFWAKEKVPLDVKETVLRPFLKAIDKDSTNPDYYRPIALLSTVRKIYEQILKTRLHKELEKANFF